MYLGNSKFVQNTSDSRGTIAGTTLFDVFFQLKDYLKVKFNLKKFGSLHCVLFASVFKPTEP